MSTRFAVLVSGSGTNLQALLDAADVSPFEVAVVISNREDAFGLERARRAGVKALCIPHKGKSRSAFDAEVAEVLKSHEIDWVFLAGFMRILTPVFLDTFPNRVVNIHPSLLPSFPGVNAQQQAFDSGVQVSGATVHFVDAGMDTGPIIAQGVVPVLDTDTVETLQTRILSMEHRLFPMVMQWAAEGRISMHDGKADVTLCEGDKRLLWMGD